MMCKRAHRVANPIRHDLHRREDRPPDKMLRGARAPQDDAVLRAGEPAVPDFRVDEVGRACALGRARAGCGEVVCSEETCSIGVDSPG